ncbi:MAG: sensor domain-containing diguanylate cyclase, partial [Candidatus Omnitrophica bacterium]|nr:sensor domain-containing diguanylate cyclase [Candidatus Omnitrophota bacterium]
VIFLRYFFQSASPNILRAVLFYLNIPVFFIWLALGPAFGVPVFLLTVFILVACLDNRLCVFPISTFFLTSLAGFKVNRSFKREVKEIEVAVEKVEGELNVLLNDIKSEENDNIRIRGSLRRITCLKGIIDGYSHVFSEDATLDGIINNCFDLFENADRILLYLVDTGKQELKLVRSKRRKGESVIKEKKGDIFDRWVLKHRMPLSVENIYNDFRFSTKDITDRAFNSVINAPLTSENKILGVLRVDSLSPSAFGQSDLRFLDIIADLSSVSLENAILYGKVENLAIHDSLTGLYVHKYFLERLNAEAKRLLRGNGESTLLMLDLDNFKSYNDRYGHNAGDLALRHVSSILKSFVQPGDILSRYGGEEFTFFLAGKGKKEGVALAEAVRKKVSQTSLVLRRKKTRITVSIGAASFPSETKDINELLTMVDSRLYKAKRRGKNRVCAGD